MSSLSPALATLAPVPSGPRLAVAVKASLLDLLFPPRCATCGRAGAALCAACLAQVQPVPQPVCVRCGRPARGPGPCEQCLGRRFHVSALRAAALYAQPLSRAIHRFKYEGHPELHQPLGQLLAAAWQAQAASADLVAAVPLHAKRERERGYNQSQLLAQVLCRQAGLPLLVAGVLRRERATQQQVRLGPAERRANVQGAFGWGGPSLDGLTVLLVDDVATTGSTLEACAQVLLLAGAAQVWALTVARAVGAPA